MAPTKRVDPRPPRALRRDVQGDSPSDRLGWGKSIRTEVARSSIGSWAPAVDRPDPVAMVLEQSAARVPHLVPIRHGRMLVSAFTFYRGGALIMAADLARAPSSGIYVQSCGDAHLSNFGVFATPERRLAFDINDFDETHPAPFEWDVLRLAASIIVAADDNGLGRRSGKRMVKATVQAYRERMRQLAGERFLDVWYSAFDLKEQIESHGKASGARVHIEKGLRKARRKTNVGALDRLAEHVDGTWRIREEPPLIVHGEITPATYRRLAAFFADYAESMPSDLQPLLRHYRLADLARKVVGVGSVGTEAFVALLVGTRTDDALFLQFKQAGDSVLERYTVDSDFSHHGERVVFGQRLMQASSDIFLGHSSAAPGKRAKADFYIRQLNDWKASANIADMGEKRLTRYVVMCAEALARAHARSGSANAISGYLGKGAAFDRAAAEFGVAYANQNVRDYRAFAAAADDGRVEVVHDV
jgi:uncharacterized protein (DUF2252 family)